MTGLEFDWPCPRCGRVIGGLAKVAQQYHPAACPVDYQVRVAATVQSMWGDWQWMILRPAGGLRALLDSAHIEAVTVAYRDQGPHHPVAMQWRRSG